GVGTKSDRLADISRPLQLLFQHLGRIFLVEQAGLEIETRRQSHVGVARAGIAVVTDYTVSDEIARSRCNVVEAHRAHRLNGLDAQRRFALDGLAFNVELPTDRRIKQVKEAQMFPETTYEPHHLDRLLPLAAR